MIFELHYSVRALLLDCSGVATWGALSSFHCEMEPEPLCDAKYGSHPAI